MTTNPNTPAGNTDHASTKHLPEHPRITPKAVAALVAEAEVGCVTYAFELEDNNEEEEMMTDGQNQIGEAEMKQEDTQATEPKAIHHQTKRGADLQISRKEISAMLPRLHMLEIVHHLRNVGRQSIPQRVAQDSLPEVRDDLKVLQALHVCSVHDSLREPSSERQTRVSVGTIVRYPNSSDHPDIFMSTSRIYLGATTVRQAAIGW